MWRLRMTSSDRLLSAIVATVTMEIRRVGLIFPRISLIAESFLKNFFCEIFLIFWHAFQSVESDSRLFMFFFYFAVTVVYTLPPPEEGENNGEHKKGCCCCCWRLVFDPFFELFILICIIMNTLFMALDHHNMDRELERVLKKGNYVRSSFDSKKFWVNHKTKAVQKLFYCSFSLQHSSLKPSWNFAPWIP